MPCFNPLQAWRKNTGKKPDGTWPITFSLVNGDMSEPLTIPCGTCTGCRMNQARQWTARLLCEKQMYEKACFITLTYNEENCPDSLSVKDTQNFLKRLRKAVKKDYDITIRFFQCGEYGTNYRRPHYHAVIFNFDFPDKYIWNSKSGIYLYRSPYLETLWKLGFCTVGNCTPESIAYVARYVVKKQRGVSARFDYQGHTPEFITMSRRPGIGRTWFEKYHNDVTATDQVIISNKLTLRTPRYYDSIYHNIQPDHLERIKKQRLASINKADNTPARLKVKQKLLQIQLQEKERSYECQSSKSSQSVIQKSLPTTSPLLNSTKFRQYVP